MAGTTSHTPPSGKEPPVLTIRNLHVGFSGAPAVQDLSLVVHRGETLGVVGESGSGKSVTFLAAMRLLPPKTSVTGRITLGADNLLQLPERRMTRIRGGRIGLIPQDPGAALNPMMRVGRQICETLWLHQGLGGSGARAEARRLLDQVGIPNAAARIDRYPFEFSGGQKQRIMIALALAGKPDLLVADEPITALDVTIQAQILELLVEVQRDTGMAMVLISHDLGVISQTCQRVAVMYAGRIVEESTASALFHDPAHPYTRGLLRSLPELSGPRRRLSAIPGMVPNPRDLPSGCAFAPRCELVREGCHDLRPGLAPIGGTRRVACKPVEDARNRPLLPSTQHPAEATA